MSIGGMSIMVEKSLFQEPPYIKNLSIITAKIENFQKKCRQNSVTDEEIKELISELEIYTKDAHEDLFEAKKISTGNNEFFNDTVNDRIEHALNAVLTFNRTNTLKSSQKNINEVIASLFANLDNEMMKFEATIKNIKEKWKAYTDKIQKVGKAKEG
jgi:hypothetical protein